MSDESRVFYPPVGTGNIELKLSNEKTNGALSMFVQTLPDGEGTNVHLHKNCEETAYVLEGRIRVSLGDKIHEFGAGDTMFGPRGMPHSIANAGDGTAGFLFITPPRRPGEIFRGDIGPGQQYSGTHRPASEYCRKAWSGSCRSGHG
jgi:quercetin dioxygenase-like cupin family protein